MCHCFRIGQNGLISRKYLQKFTIVNKICKIYIWRVKTAIIQKKTKSQNKLENKRFKKIQGT